METVMQRARPPRRVREPRKTAATAVAVACVAIGAWMLATDVEERRRADATPSLGVPPGETVSMVGPRAFDSRESMSTRTVASPLEYTVVVRDARTRSLLPRAIIHQKRPDETVACAPGADGVATVVRSGHLDTVLLVEAPGYWPVTLRESSIHAGDAGAIDILLHPIEPVVVDVVDDQGRPVVDADVEVVWRGTMLRAGLPNVIAPRGRTDAIGRITVDLPGVGSVHVTVTHPSLTQGEIARRILPCGESITVRMCRGPVFAVRLLGARGAGHAFVELSDGVLDRRFRTLFLPETLQSDDHLWRLGAVSPGVYSIAVQVDGSPVYQERNIVIRDEAVISIRVGSDEREDVLVRILDEVGHPVGGVQLLGPVGTSVSSERGLAVVRRRKGEELRALIERAGFERTQFRVAPGVGSADVTVRRLRQGTLTCDVTLPGSESEGTLIRYWIINSAAAHTSARFEFMTGGEDWRRGLAVDDSGSLTLRTDGSGSWRGTASVLSGTVLGEVVTRGHSLGRFVARVEPGRETLKTLTATSIVIADDSQEGVAWIAQVPDESGHGMFPAGGTVVYPSRAARHASVVLERGARVASGRIRQSPGGASGSGATTRLRCAEFAGRVVALEPDADVIGADRAFVALGDASGVIALDGMWGGWWQLSVGRCRWRVLVTGTDEHIELPVPHTIHLAAESSTKVEWTTMYSWEGKSRVVVVSPVVLGAEGLWQASAAGEQAIVLGYSGMVSALAHARRGSRTADAWRLTGDAVDCEIEMRQGGAPTLAPLELSALGRSGDPDAVPEGAILAARSVPETDGVHRLRAQAGLGLTVKPAFSPGVSSVPLTTAAGRVVVDAEE